MFLNKKEKNKKASRSKEKIDIDNYEIVEETTNKNVTQAIFGKEPSDEIYSKRIYSAPHMIVAGTTGSGKSVNVNSLLGSMMLTATPKQLRFIIIDPKAVEFSAYNDSPYMITNPITDMDKASKALKWLVNLMQERYDMMRRMGEKGLEVPKNIEEYNDMVKDREEEEMYYTVAVVDEFSDLIGEHPEVEGYVVRIAQKARACGISLIIATQSPRSNVITGLIKANIPTRVCMMVVSSLESNIILDEGGGELLRPHGDMLIKFNGSSELVRCQGPYISNKSIKNLIEFSKKHYSHLNKPIDIFENMSDDDEEDERIGGMRGTRGRNNRRPSGMPNRYSGRETRKNDMAEESTELASAGELLFDKPNDERTGEEIKESKEQHLKELKEENKKEEKEIKEENNEEKQKESNEEQKNVNNEHFVNHKKEITNDDIKKANQEKIRAFNQRKQMLKSRNMMDKTKENADFLMSDYAMRQHYQKQKESNYSKASILKDAMNKNNNSNKPSSKPEKITDKNSTQIKEKENALSTNKNEATFGDNKQEGGME